MILGRKVNPQLIVLGLLVCTILYALHNKYTSEEVYIDKDDYSNVIPHEDRSGFRSPWRTAIQHPVIDHVDHFANYVPEGDTHRIIYSRSTSDQKYFQVDLAGVEAYNVNIIPHPALKNKWIVTAQSTEYRDDINSSEQITCIAEFVDGVLHCSRSPAALPIATSINGKCDGEWGATNMRRGPRDARVFYGPEQPYIIYGQQSNVVCLGLWVQNLWMLLDSAKHPGEGFARSVTEILRPEPLEQIQKNYFLFWDNSSQVHAHYDIWPKRAYSQLHYDGSVVSAFLSSTGLDIAQYAAEKDDVCIENLFPKVDANAIQSIHQGTNSLSITMCNRSDPSCVENDENTFILHIMQHKNFYEYQAVYEPYPVLFKRYSPFELHAVAQKPLFYHGRNELTEKTGSRIYKEHPEWYLPEGHLEMIYTTSISWKDSKQTYHGYMDDTLLIGFGIEDTYAGAIDVLLADILQDLAYC